MSFCGNAIWAVVKGDPTLAINTFAESLTFIKNNCTSVVVHLNCVISALGNP